MLSVSCGGLHICSEPTRSDHVVDRKGRESLKKEKKKKENAR